MIPLQKREHAPSVLVAALSAAFGVSLLQLTGVLGTAIAADDVTGSSRTVGLMLGIVAVIFIGIAVYVGAIVTANTFATIIAGRTRTIALLRLIGSSAKTQRRAVAREGLGVGVVGAVLGAIVGTLATIAMTWIAIGSGWLPELAYSYLSPVLALPVVAVVLTTWAASWVGSRRVLVVTPMQAIGGSQERAPEELTGRARTATAVSLSVTGGVLLVLGIALGLVSPFGVLVAFAGGIVSFSGLIAAAPMIMPPALRFVARAFGGSATGRLAGENAMRYPERSARTTIGLVIGVTLITMFGVAVASYSRIIALAQQAQPEVYLGIDEMMNATVAVFSVLIGFSALIAAVGMANNLSLSVLQRTRELGLLRALGFTARQIRGMILAESAQLTLAAVLVGLILGAFYGWAGAQSLLGAIDGSPGLVVPGVPWVLLGVIAVAAALLTWGASLAPSRRATRVTPVAALAVD
ncbi:FtsX-like permease family protein [Lysobacter korlensis]|uniref:FtsX-like permease family protein n=1 Tax=Lysobacter korlensis TaxID=553636 RepID=A0ABV6RMN7_9GAMM